MKDQTEDRKREHVFKMIDSPIGVLKLAGNDSGLAAILWANEDPRRVRLNIVGEDKTHPVLVEVERQLGESAWRSDLRRQHADLFAGRVLAPAGGRHPSDGFGQTG